MVKKSNKLSVKVMRWIARGFGILLVAIFVGSVFEIGFVLTEIDYFRAVTIHLGDLLMGLAAIIGLAGFLLSWWGELPGGILFIIAGIAAMIIFYQDAWFYIPTADQENSLTVGILYGLGNIVPGVLFLLSWWITRKEAT